MLAEVSTHSLRKILNKQIFRNQCKYCKYSTAKSSEQIRNGFLTYFVNDNSHKFIRSSPVVPFCDPTVAFVNAGMNQFKGVFLGEFSPPFPRVANSQKCVRVGGKHNDLDVVGADGYHHTFFEMLGNWSFGDYYKLEACTMAWNLLTGPFEIDPNRLAITYFGGDKDIGLPADLECKEIWKSIGVQEKNLIPGNMSDNFWEMGTMGPCGPCTEIHYRRDDNTLMEIWNIVFIQFNRQSDHSITPLPKCHVDTGMGLERIAALLQNKMSNYDTDLFMPIINTIHQKSDSVPPYKGEFGMNTQLDTAYRTLADHSRMISICLADGVYPCRNLRLRNVLRKSISLSNSIFKCPTGMLSTLYDKVAESLGSAYPELHKKEKEVKEIIHHEETLFNTLEKSVKKQRKELLEQYPETVHLSQEFTPGLAEGYKQFKQAVKKIDSNKIPGNLAFKMYDTFGLDETMIHKIAEINKMSVDMDSFRDYLLEHKMKHKAVFVEAANKTINIAFNSAVDQLVSNGLTTDDSCKYKYLFKDGVFSCPHLKSRLVGILSSRGDITHNLEIDFDNDYNLIFDKTNFYCEEGGQIYDSGKVRFNNAVFKVNSVSKVRGLVLHTGRFKEREGCEDNRKKISVGDLGDLYVNCEKRLSVMQHHTATHLLNAALKQVLSNSVTCQLSSRVTDSGLVLELAVYGDKLSPQSILDAQELVRMACSKSACVKTTLIDGQKLLSYDDVTTVPGEIYPEIGLRLVEIDLLGTGNVFSRELCCGTHVTSTDLIGDFCITGIRGAGGHAPTIRAVAGSLATKVYKLVDKARNLQKELEYSDISDKVELQETINGIRNELNELCKGEGAPYGPRAECLELLSSVEKKIKNKDTKSLVDLVKSEMAMVMAENATKPFVVHFLICSYLLEPSNLSLSTAIECGKEKPIFILGCACGIIKATCYVPQHFISSNFTAEKWMNSILPTFGTQIIAPTKNQDLNVIAHMKGKKVSLTNCENLVADAIKKATTYAEIHIQTKNEQNQSYEVFNKIHEKRS